MRRNLGITVDKEQLESMKLIQAKMKCAQQALSLVPDGLSEEALNQYVKAVVNTAAEINYLERIWWDDKILKYGLVGNVYLDFTDGSLYQEE